MKAASAPVKKAPQLEEPGEVERNGGDEQQQQQDHPRVLKLEGPAHRRAAGPERQQRTAEREAGQHHARRIGQGLAPRLALGPARPGEAERLQAEDREDAGHDVEDQPAEQSAEQRRHQARPLDTARFLGRLGNRRAGGRHIAGPGGQGKARAPPDRKHALERPDRAGLPPGRRLDDQEIAAARQALRRGIAERIGGAREEIGAVDRRARRQRDGEANPPALDREPRLGAQWAGQSLAPGHEGGIGGPRRAGAEIDRHAGAFGHADFVGADEVIEPRIDRKGNAGLCALGQADRRQQRIFAFVDIVHQPGDAEPHGHRILERIGAPALGQPPLDARLGAGVARIAPIAVPARLRPHDECKRDGGAGRRGRRLGDQAHLHMARPLRARGAGAQQGEQDDKKWAEPIHEGAIACPSLSREGLGVGQRSGGSMPPICFQRR